MIWVAIDRPISHESTYRLEHEHRYETQLVLPHVYRALDYQV